MTAAAGFGGGSGGQSQSQAPQQGTPTPCPPSLFVAASNDQRDCDDQRDTSQAYENYIGGLCGAICSAWSTWQSSAVLTGVQINAVTAFGGQVIAPPVEPLILAGAPKASEWQLRRSSAVARTLGEAFRSMALEIRVRGLPWYPAFAAFPAPFAPPTPNVPTPLVTIYGGDFSAARLKQNMVQNFGAPNEWSTEVFECIAKAVETCHTLWKASTMVTKVLGTGPIPTFAPPYVPVGPVVGGTGNMTPGGFV